LAFGAITLTATGPCPVCPRYTEPKEPRPIRLCTVTSLKGQICLMKAASTEADSAFNDHVCPERLFPERLCSEFISVDPLEIAGGFTYSTCGCAADAASIWAASMAVAEAKSSMSAMSTRQIDWTFRRSAPTVMYPVHAIPATRDMTLRTPMEIHSFLVISEARASKSSRKR